MPFTPILKANIISGQPISKPQFGDLVADNFDDHEAAIGALETLTSGGGTTGSGNTTLSTRLGTGVTTSNTATSQLNAITTNLGTWSGGTAISRLQSLEAAEVSGHWQAPASGKTAVSYGTAPTDTDVVMATVVKTPIGCTNSSGVITIGAGNAGWYQVEARYDLNMTVGTTQRVDCYFKSSGGTVLGCDTRFYPATGFGFHTWSCLVYLNAGDTIKPGCKVWTTSGSGTYAVADDSAARTWLKIARVGR